MENREWKTCPPYLWHAACLSGRQGGRKVENGRYYSFNIFNLALLYSLEYENSESSIKQEDL